MKTILQGFKSGTTALLIGVCIVAFSGRSSVAQQGNEGPGVPLQTSINEIMVALVDHAAHELWDAAAAETMTDRDWQAVEQHAVQSVAAGTLMSLGGTGSADVGWVAAPEWREWTQRYTDAALAALTAVQDADQEALDEAGGEMLDACIGCHDAFKPDVPTEGILHVPHYK